MSINTMKGAEIMSDKRLPIYNSPHITFEKWVDPYNGKNVDVDEFYEDDEIPYKEHNVGINIPNNTLFTPLGHLSLDYPMTKNINLWMGHTNFSITAKLAKIIEETDGVESLDVFTRYRFRVGIANLFLARTVKKAIITSIRRALNGKTSKSKSIRPT